MGETQNRTFQFSFCFSHIPDDIFFPLDNGERIVNGQRPYAHYYSPECPFTFRIVALCNETTAQSAKLARFGYYYEEKRACVATENAGRMFGAENTEELAEAVAEVYGLLLERPREVGQAAVKLAVAYPPDASAKRILSSLEGFLEWGRIADRSVRGHA